MNKEHYMIKVIDTFSFNGECIVKLRLKYLEPFVDEFVIVEAWHTHSNKKKEELYSIIHKDWFTPYEHKIKWIIIHDFPEMTPDWFAMNSHHQWMASNHEHWFREMFQRDSPMSYIKTKYKGSQYIVIVADVDEIPKNETLVKDKMMEMITYNEPIFLEMMFLYYNFNWKKQYMWYKTFLLPGSKMNDKGFSTLRINYNPKLVLRDAGWHLSYFMNSADLVRKLSSFAHRECDDESFRTEEHMRDCIQTGKDLFKRGLPEDCIKVSDCDVPITLKDCNSNHDTHVTIE